MKNICTSFFLLVLLLFSCNRIETADTLSKSDIQYIESLNLLEKNEKIYQFYSEYKKKVAGNFFTDRRLATYWIDEKDKSRDVVAYAFYCNIRSIDTIYDAGATYCPYMLIRKTDNSTFRVSVDGKKQEVKSFFEEALNLWKRNRGVLH